MMMASLTIPRMASYMVRRVPSPALSASFRGHEGGLRCFSTVIETPRTGSMVSTSAQERQREQEEKERRKREQEAGDDSGHSDWFYVFWSGLGLLLLGGPSFGIYQLRYEREVRDWAEERAPWLIERIQPYLDLYPDVDPHYRDVERCNTEETLQLVFANGETQEVRTEPHQTLEELSERFAQEHPGQSIEKIMVKEDQKNPNLQPLSPLAIHHVTEEQLEQTRQSLEDVKQSKEKLREKYLNGRLSKIEKAMARDLMYQYEQQREALGAQLQQMEHQWKAQQRQNARNKSVFRRMVGL
eukprot:gb/GECG01010939.1/.p1 GENE.gb/GECG01010939.1/~~gb/GECG01010939.1/.p1  ORF type:complete len:299 (+),score=44.27 gb/GECG01010939.1/:1-897(+)